MEVSTPLAKSDFSLSTDEKNKVQEFRKEAQRSKDMELNKRARAILLLGDEKKTRAESAEMCEVCLKTIYNWQDRYKESGIEGIKPLPRGGKEKRLNKEQLDTLTELIIAGPEQSGYETGIWTGPLVVELIKRKFSINYSASQVRRILNQLGFSIQYPKKNWQRQTTPLKVDG